MWIHAGARHPALKGEKRHYIARDVDGHDIGMVCWVEHTGEGF
jgi:hypothetical protein